MKTLFTVLLLALFASPVLAEEAAVATPDSAQTPQITNVAYYFMNTVRCPSCQKIEKYSHEAIEAGFAPQLAAGQLAWMMKNLDEEANAHFIDEYKLFTKSLVLVRYENGTQIKWKNCDKVWELLGDEAAFKKYVTAEVASFLGE
ncbi:MAG: hypothetical protein IPH10_08480 [bacterium]|nr:hypothetical protein [bacterium]